MSDQKVTPQQLTAQIVSNEMKSVMEMVDNSFNSLVLQNDHAKLPEDVFRHHFLPFFTGEVPKDRNCIAEWIGIAGTPTSKVDVVSPAGDVLFTVPPVLDSSIVNLGQVGGKRIKDLVIEYNLHTEGLPGAASAFANNVIVPHMQKIVPGHSDETEASKDWNKVFDYYGLNPNAKAEEAKADESNPGDDLVYE